MAATKSHAKPATLGTVLKAVQGGFAAVAEDISDLRRETKDDIAAVKKAMATKRDIAGIMEELADIKQRLKDVEAVGRGSASIAVGGREAVNLWQERDQLAALDQNASDRNRMKVELNGRLNDLQQQHDRLVWAVQHAKPAISPQ